MILFDQGGRYYPIDFSEIDLRIEKKNFKPTEEFDRKKIIGLYIYRIPRYIIIYQFFLFFFRKNLQC